MNQPPKKHNHENCKQLLGSLSTYVDGELSEELCAVLEQHLEECSDCRIVVDTLKKTVYLYHASASTETIPMDIKQRLYKSLDIDGYLGNEPQ